MIEIRKVRESSNGKLELSDWTWEAYAYDDETRTVLDKPITGIENKLFMSKTLARIPFNRPLHLAPRDVQSYITVKDGVIRQVGVVSEDDLATIVCVYQNEVKFLAEEESKTL